MSAARMPQTVGGFGSFKNQKFGENSPEKRGTLALVNTSNGLNSDNSYDNNHLSSDKMVNKIYHNSITE